MYAYELIAEAQKVCVSNVDFDKSITGNVYAFDSTTIDLCLNVFWWAPFRRAKGAVKLHTLLDVRTAIPVFMHITPATARLIDYYRSNINRMDYKYYVTIGKGLIGPGAIESAHRTVIQCRMKRSGQRWSKKGAANMLCLRTIKMNKQWDEVINIV